VKSFLKITGIIASLALCLCLLSCTGRDGADTTAPADTTEEVTTAPDTTSPVEPTEKETFTVPLRHEKDGRLQWEYTYSADGMSISKTDYTEDPPITYTVYFDEGGLPLRMEWLICVNDTRTEKWRDDYYLDESGRIVDEKRFCEGEIQNAYTYTYDENGRIATQQSRNVAQQNTVYRLLYDEMGTHVGTRFERYNGERGYYHEMKTCTYDDEGRILTETTESVKTTHVYTLTEGLVTQEKVTNDSAGFLWSYYYGYTYENGCLVRKDCSYEGTMTDSEFFCETKYGHYYDAINWIFRERLP